MTIVSCDRSSARLYHRSQRSFWSLYAVRARQFFHSRRRHEVRGGEPSRVFLLSTGVGGLRPARPPHIIASPFQPHCCMPSEGDSACGSPHRFGHSEGMRAGHLSSEVFLLGSRGKAPGRECRGGGPPLPLAAQAATGNESHELGVSPNPSQKDVATTMFEEGLWAAKLPCMQYN